MKLIYTLKEFQLQCKYMKFSELENVIGKKLGTPETVEKPEIKITIELTPTTKE